MVLHEACFEFLTVYKKNHLEQFRMYNYCIFSWLSSKTFNMNVL